MSRTDLSPAEQATRGKRLLIYGMFALVVVTVLALFLTPYLLLAPLGATDVAIQSTLIVGAIAIVACATIWFIYTKLILKQ